MCFLAEFATYMSRRNTARRPTTADGITILSALTDGKNDELTTEFELSDGIRRRASPVKGGQASRNGRQNIRRNGLFSSGISNGSRPFRQSCLTEIGHFIGHSGTPVRRKSLIPSEILGKLKKN